MRVIDKDKIERVKVEAKKLIVEKGYHGASIAEIAKRAGVSDGYLYRFHKNKREMVSFLFENQLKAIHNHVFELLDTKKTFKEVTHGIISNLFELHEREPYAISFLNSLIYDFEFEYPQSRIEAIDKMIPQILEFGHNTEEISKKIRAVDIMTVIFNIPSKYLEYKQKTNHNFFKSKYLDPKSNKEEIELLLNICMNALK